MKTFLTTWLSPLTLTWALLGCGEQSGTGNTNWRLECESDSECDGEHLCQCGYCGEPCSGTLDCDRSPENQCVSPQSSETPDDVAKDAGSQSIPPALGPDSDDDIGDDDADEVPRPSETDAGDEMAEPEQGTGGVGNTEMDAGTSQEEAPASDAGATPGMGEPCSLPIGEWQPITGEPALAHLTSIAEWHDGALHYVGDGLTGSSSSSQSFEYGRFDPCSNGWERTSFPLDNDARTLLGWDGSGFAFHPLNQYFVLNTTGLDILDGAGARFSLGDDELEPITEAFRSGNVLVYPMGTAPEAPPGVSTYFNGATNGERAFVWGPPIPTEEDPAPAPRGFVLEPGALSWRAVSAEGAPTARHFHSMIAAGDRFVVWGGSVPDDTSAALNDGAFYDPETDSWEAIPTDGAPVGGNVTPLHWMGERLVVRPGGYGGVYEAGGGWQPLDLLDNVPNPKKLEIDDDRMLFVSGLEMWTLDVSSGTWATVPSPIGATGIQNEPNFFHVVWTGSTVLFWGSSVPQECVAPEGVPGCDLIDPYLPAGEGVMVRLE